MTARHRPARIATVLSSSSRKVLQDTLGDIVFGDPLKPPRVHEKNRKSKEYYNETVAMTGKGPRKGL